VQLAVADPPPPMVPELQDAIPDRLSLPDAVKSTGWLYQLPASGPRASAIDTEGRVASYLKVNDPPLAELPALSTHDPLRLPLVVSGPLYDAELHEAMPDVASLPFTEIESGWLYQPFASGPRALMPEITGGVESFFTVAVELDVVLPPESTNVTVQVWLTPVVSELCVKFPQPVGFETELPATGVTTKLTVTADLYHPPQFDGAGEQL
jgi:hypothetical protein